MAAPILAVKHLHQRMQSGEPLFILDVRAWDGFVSWKIDGGPNVQIVNAPYSETWGEEERNLRDLPKDREIIVNCNRGIAAQIIGDFLAEKGYQAVVLEQGMQGWSQFYHPVTVARNDRFKLIQINRLGKGCLSYMVISQGEALVVDAGRHIDVYIELAEAEGVRIKHVVDTHLHADHISGGRHLAAATGATYCISANDLQEAPFEFAALETRNAVAIGSIEVRIVPVETPGHTPGSVSLLVDGQYLLSGDTIFVGGLGRPDLGGRAREWAQSLYDTVFRTVCGFSDDVIVLPAHFSNPREEINAQGYVGALLGDIRRTNQAMLTEDREQFVEMVAGRAGQTPPNYTDIVRINRGQLEVDLVKATQLENGPNRCAVKHT